MPETPKSNTDRELWREREGDYYADSVSVTEQGSLCISVGGTTICKSLADWHRASLPPQAAAVPARQDAVPEPSQPRCRYCGHFRAMHDGWRWCTLPTQTAVGEGIDIEEACRRVEAMSGTTPGFFWKHYQAGTLMGSLLIQLELMKRLISSEVAHREAIAQRDEARKGYRCYHCKRMFPEDTTHFGKYEELPKCLEHIRSGSGGDCHDAYIRVRRDVWESMTTVSPAVAGAIQRFNKRADELGLNHHVEIPNSAALDVPKPEEIERLADAVSDLRESISGQDPRYIIMRKLDAVERILSRLRSLPSEPAGKAGGK